MTNTDATNFTRLRGKLVVLVVALVTIVIAGATWFAMRGHPAIEAESPVASMSAGGSTQRPNPQGTSTPELLSVPASTLKGVSDSHRDHAAENPTNPDLYARENQTTWDQWKLKLGDPRLSKSATQEMIAWLNANKFPSQAAAEAAFNNPHDISELNPNNGISAYEIKVAESIATANPQQRKQALGFLALAATEGSTAALYSLARYYGSARVNKPVYEEAYFTAAFLLGDWYAPMQYRTLSARALGVREKKLAKMYAMLIVRKINKQRAEMGLPPLSQDSRPMANKLKHKVSGRE